MKSSLLIIGLLLSSICFGQDGIKKVMFHKFVPLLNDTLVVQIVGAEVVNCKAATTVEINGGEKTGQLLLNASGASLSRRSEGVYSLKVSCNNQPRFLFVIYRQEDKFIQIARVPFDVEVE